MTYRNRFSAAVLAAVSIVGIVFSSAQAQPPAGKLSAGGPQTPGGGAGPAGAGAGGNSTAFFDSQMLAYGAINEIAFSISHSICEGPNALPENANVVIYDQTSFQNLQAWQALSASVATLETEYQTLSDTIDALTRPAPTAPVKPGNEVKPVAPVTPAVGGGFFAGSDVSGLIGALGASTVNTATTFTIPDSTIAVSLIHQFNRRDQFVAPSACQKGLLKVTYFPLIGNAHTEDTKLLTNLFKNLNDKRTKIQKYLATRPQPANAAPTQPPAGVVQGPGQSPAQGSPQTPTDPLTSAFTDLNTQYDAIVATLTTSISQNQAPTAMGSPAGVTSIVDGARVETVMKNPNTYILYADIVAAGGIQKDVKNFITVLFTGDWIWYSGGAIVNYGLVKADGTVVAADVLRYRTPYTHLWHPHESHDLESTDSQDNLLTLCNHEVRAIWPGGADNTGKCNFLKALNKRNFGQADVFQVTATSTVPPPGDTPPPGNTPTPSITPGGPAPAPAVPVVPVVTTPDAPAPSTPVVPTTVSGSGHKLDCHLMSDETTAWGEFYLDTGTGKLTYGGQNQTVAIVPDDANQYGFIGQAWGNTFGNPSFAEYHFNVTISRSTGEFYIYGSWTGPTAATTIKGKCTPVAAPKM